MKLKKQRHSAKCGTRLLAFLLALVMVLGMLPAATVQAAAKAKPEKITLVGSDAALEYEYVDDLTYSWEDIPRYKVYVPTGTTQVSLYGTVYINSSSGSGYCSEADLDPSAWTYEFEYWTNAMVGSAAPYTIETRTNGSKTQNLAFVKVNYYVSGPSDAYILQFVEKDKLPASAEPTFSKNLSSSAVTYTAGDDASALSVTAAGAGSLTYQWQVSTTSATAGFTDIAGEKTSSYTPSTKKPGSYWYRVSVTHTESGKDPVSVNSTVTPVVVKLPEGTRQVEITTTIGYTASNPIQFTLKNASGATIPTTADTSSGYAVYDLLIAPGTYTFEAAVPDDDTHFYKAGSGSFTVTEAEEVQTFGFYLTYVYAQQSGWTKDDFTTDVKTSSGTVAAPGEAYKFASYVAYPYMLEAGSYTYQITPSTEKAEEGYQKTSVISKTLSKSKYSTTWSSKVQQTIETVVTVPKGAVVTMTAAPSAPYQDGDQIVGTADKTGTEADQYKFSLTAGTSYIYRAKKDGKLTQTGVLTASSENKSMDLTAKMEGSSNQIKRNGDVDTADIRISGVDHTGSLALQVNDTKKLTPLRMWQIANDSTPTSKMAYALEPDFHYTVVELDGTGVIEVAEDGTIEAKREGTALVLITYDALQTGNTKWGVNKDKTFSAIWPENTGVVVVEVGENAADGPAVNLTINSGAKKTAGTSLDAETDVLYYSGDAGRTYTFKPASGSDVTLLRPTLGSDAVSYTGGFTKTGVEAGTDGSVTLTLKKGRNIVKVSDASGDSYQVITVKDASAEITNVTHPNETIHPGDQVKVQLNGIYHPQNYMAYLNNFYAVIGYTDPGSNSKVKGTQVYNRHDFENDSGAAARTITVTIPQDWDTSKPYTLAQGSLLLYGNGKDIGSHRTGLSSLSSAVPYISNSAAFSMGSLPDITIPVEAYNEGTVNAVLEDDQGAAVSGSKIVFVNEENASYTLDTSEKTSIELPIGTWSYTITKENYLPVQGTLTVAAGSQDLEETMTLITDLRIDVNPQKLNYVEGETLNLTGMVVKGVTRSGEVTMEQSLLTVTPKKVTQVGTETITVSYGTRSTTFTVSVAKEVIDLTTSLQDGITQKNSRKTFDVFAKDSAGKKLPSSDVVVTLNDVKVAYNWDDDVKTSYTLQFTKEGENIVKVTARGTSLTYKINYVKAEEGEVIGQVVFAMDAFTVGGGYLIEPCYVDIIEGENGAVMLTRILEEYGYEYDNTGSIESSFYLAAVRGTTLEDIDVNGEGIPEVLRTYLTNDGFNISAREDGDRLGEFDYTQGSGWMVTINNVFPNVGFSDHYLSDGDVCRVQYTLAYGNDIGGGYATGTNSASYYPIANKDKLTAKMAEINRELEENSDYLTLYGLTEAYENALSVLATVDSSQEDVDAALEALKTAADLVEGYAVSAGGEKEISLGEEAEVSIRIQNQDESSYNAYHLAVEYDADRLTYKKINTDASVKDADGTLTISGYGQDKECNKDKIILTFEGKAAGSANVKITQAYVDKAANANTQDAPRATVVTDTTVIKVAAVYMVDLGEGFTGAGTAKQGKDYTFTAADVHYDYTFTATMGGSAVNVVDNQNGTYTIKNVQGNLVIRVNQKTAKSYDVTISGTGAEDVTGEKKATYQTNYQFVVNKADTHTYEVTVKVGNNPYTPTLDEDGKTYTIPGSAVTGAITIEVEKTLKPITETEITFTGSGSGDVQGGTTQKATNGVDFTFTITKDDAYEYTVSIGQDVLTAEETGEYKIAGSRLTGSALTVTVEKTVKETLTVNAAEYIKLSQKTIWLITASGSVSDGKVLAYDGEAMFWSSKYEAYCWLLVSDQTLEHVKTAAAEKITEAAAQSVQLKYDMDVNQTGQMDVNDAQLTYDLYNAKYTDFETVSMLKFLEADVNGDKTVSTLDAAAIVAEILK